MNTEKPLESSKVDLQDLRKSALQNVLIGCGFIVFLFLQRYAYGLVLRPNVSETTYTNVHWIWLSVSVILAFAIWLSHRYQKRDEVELAAQIIMTGLVIVTNILLLLPSALESFYPYLPLMVVAVAGLLIMPRGAFLIAGTNIIINVMVVGLSQPTKIDLLIIPNILATILAFITWGGANNLITAYSWAVQSQAKAKTRRDEMFEVQQEIKKAYQLLETTNFRLAQSESNLKMAHAELEVLVVDLQRLNASKDKFFSIVAHDLRGPFSPLLGASELLAEMADVLKPEDIKEMGQSLYRSARNVFNLLENLLEWSRMQMGRMEYQPEIINLEAIVEQNVKLLTETAVNKGINLQTTLHQPLFIYADQHMIDTVIRNLTANALKFTPQGGTITIAAQVCETKAESMVRFPTNDVNQALPYILSTSSHVEVSVSDTGVGIAAEDVEKLFKIEVHHTTLGTNKEQGTGLGLVMCLEMVQKNGGNIWVESVLGEGTQFKFTVPWATIPVSTDEKEFQLS